MRRESSITVVIPHFNHGHLIGDQLAAVFAQSRPAARVIIVDDASTDGSVDVIRQLIAGRADVELVCLDANAGPVAAMNGTLGGITTDYVTFLAADDRIFPAMFERSLSMLDAWPDAAVFSAVTRSEGDGAPGVIPDRHARPSASQPYLSPSRVRTQLTRVGSWYLGCTAVYRTALLRAAGGFPPGLHSYSDEFTFSLLALRHGACFLPEVLAVNRRSVAGYASTETARVERATQIFTNANRLMSTTYAALFPPGLVARINGRLLFTMTRRQLNGFLAQMEDLAGSARPFAGQTVFLSVCRAFIRLLTVASFIALRTGDVPRVGIGRILSIVNRVHAQR